LVFSLCPFRTENANVTLNSKITPFSKRRSFSFGVNDKIGILLEFFIRKGQNEKKLNFNTPKREVLNIKRVFIKVIKVHGSK
jgi:hypothetical protein